MNILHISRTMGQGGAEKIVYQLSVGMKEKGWNIVVASSGGVYAEQLETCGIVHYHLADLECKNLPIILKTFHSLSYIIRKEKIDIIHTHHRMAALYARLLKLFYPKVKLIYTAHNIFENKRLLTRASLSKTFIVAVGKGVKQNLMEFFGVDEKSIQIIYNAVNIEKPEKSNENEELCALKEQGCILVTVVGRLSEQKGIDVFVRAIEKVREKLPQVKGVIIGDGELRESLEQLVTELGLTSEILFLGYQEHVTTLVSQVDLLVQPSRWEGSSLTMIEGFAMQKTGVVSDIGGINEIVRNEENGLLVPKDQPEAFSEAIIRLLMDGQLRMRLEEQGKNDFENCYRYDRFISNYENFYRKVMSGGTES